MRILPNLSFSSLPQPGGVGLPVLCVPGGPTHGTSLRGAVDDEAERAGRGGDGSSSCGGGGAARAAGNWEGVGKGNWEGVGTRRQASGAAHPCASTRSPLSLPTPGAPNESGRGQLGLLGPGNSQELYIHLLFEPSLLIPDKAQRRGPAYPGSQSRCIVELDVTPKAPEFRTLQRPRASPGSGQRTGA